MSNERHGGISDNGGAETDATWLDLYDYRRRVSGLYRERERAALAGEDDLSVLERFRAGRDALFASHPQSALSVEQRRDFSGLSYFDYDPAFQVEALLTPELSDEVVAAADGPHTLPMRRAARLEFALEGMPLHLAVYWLDVYGGGLFLPFRDATCPAESYGGGRYLFDTVKGSDFLRLDRDDLLQSYGGGRVLLDFNYAYNPSCAYNSKWVCPLAPPENRLTVAVRAGERKYG